MALDDLYSGDQIDTDPALPTVMDATVLTVDLAGRLTVTVPALDAGERGRAARGTFPAAEPGDVCWVIGLPDGGLLALGVETSSS